MRDSRVSDLLLIGPALYHPGSSKVVYGASDCAAVISDHAQIAHAKALSSHVHRERTICYPVRRSLLLSRVFYAVWQLASSDGARERLV